MHKIQSMPLRVHSLEGETCKQVKYGVMVPREAFAGAEVAWKMGEGRLPGGGAWERSGKAFRLKKQRERRHKGVELSVLGAGKAN